MALDWYTQGRGMHYHFYRIVYIKAPLLSVEKKVYGVAAAGFVYHMADAMLKRITSLKITLLLSYTLRNFGAACHALRSSKVTSQFLYSFIQLFCPL